MADGDSFYLERPAGRAVGVSPMTTLLDWLRDHRGLKGTKEGCAEGDCGACTVVLERADGRREAINACIALLGQIDGQAVRTVEGLRRPDGTPHPVQARAGRRRCHAMRLLHAGLRDVGLCLCRGWREARCRDDPRCAGRQSLPLHRLPADRRGDDHGSPACRSSPRRAAPLRTRLRHRSGYASTRRARSAELLALRARHPEALLLAGATDLGLLASRSRKPPAAIIHVAHVPELTAIRGGQEEDHHRRRRDLCARPCRC